MTENNEFKCQDCVNKGTELCEHCTAVCFPSGRTSRPTYFSTVESSIIKIRLEDLIPPFGLKPRYIHDEHRAIDISKAIVRYLNKSLPIPIEWVEEYNELRTKEKSAGGKSKPQ